MSQVYRLTAESEPSCPRGTRLVVVPRPPGSGVRLWVPDQVQAVVVLVDEEGNVGWIEDSTTGRGIVDFVRPAEEPGTAARGAVTRAERL